MGRSTLRFEEGGAFHCTAVLIPYWDSVSTSQTLDHNLICHPDTTHMSVLCHIKFFPIISEVSPAMLSCSAGKRERNSGWFDS